ncbi:MAG: PAS domain-containing sensor histidine kinase [Hyphomicrobiales bacterium]|nr:PAS domain-containing sensor histidine kinase [Hyphomicrobiales bacterium]
MTEATASEDPSRAALSAAPSRPGLRRLAIRGRVTLPVLAVAMGAIALFVVAWTSGEVLRASWSDMRATHARRDQLSALERATMRLNREVKAFLDAPDEAARTGVETMKAEFTGELWRLRDGARADDGEDVEAFSDAARRYLIGFDDLRGLEIDVTLLYEGAFEEVVSAIRERLDALDLSIRPGDAALRPLVARAYDRFAAFRLALVSYRRSRAVEDIDAARVARDEFAAELRRIGADPGADSRTYAIELFTPQLARLDEMFERLTAISWRKSLWLSGYVDGNRDAMNAALERLLDRQIQVEREVFDRFEAALDGLGLRIALFVGLSLVIGVFVARRVASTILVPLAEQTTVLNALAIDRADRPVPGLDAPDEFGASARALEAVRRARAERRRREEDHALQERRWLSVLETSPIGIAVLSAADGRIGFANRRWRELFPPGSDGDAPADGNALADRFVDASGATRLAEAVSRTGGVAAWQTEMRRPDGTLWWALMEVRPIDFAGRPAHILWIYDDSEGRRAEEEIRAARDRAEAALERLARARDDLVEAEKLAAIGGLVAGVAHEVNSPVGIGLTVASTLRHRADGFAAEVAGGGLRRSRLDDFVADVREASTQLVANLTRAADLVLAFKQVAVDRTHPDRRAFDLAEATEQIVASLRPGLKTTPHRLDVDVAPGLTMDGYPGAWGQILTNLVMNAVTHAFTGDRSGVMTISARPLGEDRVRIVFADDGVGMDEETARRAFEPFFTTRRGRGGSGLGLHIVRTLVISRMGGRIRMTTAPDAGCRFEIEAPLTAPDDAAASREREEGTDARWSTTT